MKNKETSMQEQSPLADAQNSVDAAENAVSQAQSHPSSTMIQQAENSLATAGRAVSGVQSEAQDTNAYQQTVDQLEIAEAKLTRLEEND
jgi:hypothetical protein